MKRHTSQSAAETVKGFLHTVIGTSGLELTFTIQGDFVPGVEEVAAEKQGASREPALRVELAGPDMAMLTARNGELLHALEHVTAKVLRLEPEDHDRISFDADSFKADRDRELRLSATRAIETVRESGRPFSFPPMTLRERRLLHLALSESGLPTASSGDGPRRFVVLYPENQDARELTYSAPAASPGRAEAVRSSFRRR